MYELFQLSENTPAQGRKSNCGMISHPDDPFVGVDQTLEIRRTTAPLSLHIRTWEGSRQPFVLVHGLASNAHTWDGVAAHLARAGHRVISLDQRGHGRSAKPDRGYDFATMTEDLALLLDALDVEKPILAGQSWGGSVMLAFGARYPDRAQGLALVDGGFVDMQSRHTSWERVADQLKPPNLIGTPVAQMRSRMQTFHPDWSAAGIGSALANFELMADGTVRPWLTLERHMQILRAMWEMRPGELFPQVQAPTLICVAGNSQNPEWTALKKEQLALAAAGLARVETHWFENTDHDIHIQKPVELAELFLHTLNHGGWRKMEGIR